MSPIESGLKTDTELNLSNKNLIGKFTKPRNLVNKIKFSKMVMAVIGRIL